MKFSDLKNIFLNAYPSYSTLKNGKKLYQFTTAMTAGSTATTADAGSLAVTSHATGKNQVFVSDGSYWQNYEGMESVVLNMAEIATTGNGDIYAMAPFTGRLLEAVFSGIDALAAHDTNYLTFGLVNLGQAGAGSTAMLAETDPNTTKATGGSALAANTKRNLTVHGTAGNLAVTKYDRLRFRAAASGTLANTVTVPVVVLIFQRTI